MGEEKGRLGNGLQSTV